MCSSKYEPLAGKGEFLVVVVHGGGRSPNLPSLLLLFRRLAALFPFPPSQHCGTRESSAQGKGKGGRTEEAHSLSVCARKKSEFLVLSGRRCGGGFTVWISPHYIRKEKNSYFCIEKMRKGKVRKEL